MKCFGKLEGQQAEIFFEEDGGKFINVCVKLGEVQFDWFDLSTLQQEEVVREINRNWVDVI